jgi:hypothetical protein
MPFVVLVAVIIAAVLIGKDAKSRGMNGYAWGFFVLLSCIIAVPIYVIVRKPINGPPPK